jgi:cobalt/nickel transport system permease protein
MLSESFVQGASLLHRLDPRLRIVFATLMLIADSYAFVLEQEYQRLGTAIRVRGFVPGTNMHTYCPSTNGQFA